MPGLVHGFLGIGHHTCDFDAGFVPELSAGSAKDFVSLSRSDGHHRCDGQAANAVA